MAAGPFHLSEVRQNTASPERAEAEKEHKRGKKTLPIDYIAGCDMKISPTVVLSTYLCISFASFYSYSYQVFTYFSLIAIIRDS